MKLAAEEECKGFLLTCQQNREKQAIRDAYNFLGEFIERLYPDLASGKQAGSLEDEIKEMQNKHTRILYSIDTNVKCCIFVKINPEYPTVDPCRVVSEIMTDMQKEDRQLTRYCHRITPVEKAFKAEFFRMKDAVEELLAAKTKGEKHSWALNFKCRNNDKFKYKEVLKVVTELAAQFGHFSDVYYPEWTISIEINNHLMCVSILEKFRENAQFKLKKINAQPLLPMKQAPTRTSGAADREEQQEVAKPTVEPQKQTRTKEAPALPPQKQPGMNEQARKQLLEQQIQPKQDDADLF